MPAQKMSTTASDLPPQPPDIVELLERIKKLVNKTVPDGKLENRLLNLGLEEFIRSPAKETKRGLRKYGFPFKFNGQLDEAILVLAHFLDRYRDEGGDLKVYLLNNFSNGDNMDLFYWQSAKAKLYLELQNLVLQLDGLTWTHKNEDGTDGPVIKSTSRIVRIFTFRNLVDIAYLNQPAISAMIEQLATGTEIGFLFSDTFKGNDSKKMTRTQFPATMFVAFRPARPSNHIYNVFLLQDQTERNYLPYQERCKAKWFPNLNAALKEDGLKRTLALFNSENENWSNFGEDPSKVCRFEHRGSELFNKAAVMLYEAFRDSEIAKEMRDQGQDPDEFIVNKINREVFSDDFMEIQRTMSIFDQAEDICAVDASSTKKSLTVHESSPTYRQWIRKSLNRALNPKSVLKTQGKSLNRIYILKDTHEEKDDELDALLRILQYYFDYYHYDISEMDTVVRVQPDGQPPTAKKAPEWLKEYWSELRNRIRIQITTSTILKSVVDHIDSHLLARLLSDVFAPSTVTPENIHSYLIKVDYLFTGNLIYNYRNPRATPNEARDEAFLYRGSGSFNLAEESDSFFKFGQGVVQFTELQTKARMRSLLKVLEKYEKGHYENCESFRDFINSDAGQKLKKENVTDLENKLNPDEHLSLGDPQKLLSVRLIYESLLHTHYKEKFAFLHRLLETFSVEVGFFDAPDKEKIQDVYPFDKAKSVAKLNQRIKTAITKRKDRIAQLNNDLEELLQIKERDVSKGSIFISYARLDENKVFQIYDKLKEHGFTPWMDQRDLLPGQTWPRQIQRAIKNSTFFLVCVSRNSANRRGYVQREQKEALDKWKGMLLDDIYLIPARLDDCDIPETLAAEFQGVDLFKNEMWNPEGWERLLKALNAGLEAYAEKENGN